MAAVPFTKWSVVAMTVALVGVGASWRLGGGGMFSPGALHAGDTSVVHLGGVTSHAELEGRCGSCHASPWGGATMGERCLECHTDIQGARGDTTALHANLTDPGSCLACHTEHLGPRGNLTRMDASGVAHDRFRFPLTGAHTRASCFACHADARTLAEFRRAPTECVACHREDDEHRGSFGDDCGVCHATDEWGRAAFDHEFPLDHGDEGRIPCATCHEDRTDWTSYTCYGCHEHERGRIREKHLEEGIDRELEDCVRCHATGREHEGEQGEGRRERRSRRARGEEDH